MLETNSKIFFVVFFSILIASVLLTYFTIVVRGDYVTFGAEDEIPEPIDTYYDAVNLFRPNMN